MRMESSTGLGFMAVVAVSGSVALMALQIHKSLVSEFMKKVESELGRSGKSQGKKKVRFAEDAEKPLSRNKEQRNPKPRHGSSSETRIAALIGKGNDEEILIKEGDDEEELMEDDNDIPLNRLALYKGISEYRMLKRHASSSNCL